MKADYVLIFRNTKIGIIEAKEAQRVDRGRGSGERLRGKMAIGYTYSSDGRGVYGIHMGTGKEGERPGLPTPDELWNLTFAKANAWRDRFAKIFNPG